MSDPFATALAVLHSAAGSVAAAYSPLSGGEFQIRVVRAQPTEESSFRQSRIALDTNHFVIRREDVQQPETGDILQTSENSFRLTGAAMLDVEGVSWTCPFEQIA